MIEIYLALGILGLFYFNKDNQKEDVSEQPKIEKFYVKDDPHKSFPKVFPDSVKEHTNKLEKSKGSRVENKFNKTEPEKSLENHKDEPLPPDTFIGSGSLLNPDTNIFKETEETFLKNKNTGYIPEPSVAKKTKTANYFDNDNANIMLEKLTGRGKYDYKKTEAEPFFKPAKNMNNVYGSQSSLDYEQNRTNRSMKRNGELPFEQVKVGQV